MKRKLSMRFTAVLLVFCMIMSIIPAMPTATAQAVGEKVELKFAELDYNGSAYWYKNLTDISANEGNWVLNRTKTDETMLTQITTGQAGSFQFQGVFGEVYKGMKAPLRTEYSKLVFDFEVSSAGMYDLTVALKSLGANNTGVLSIAVEDGNGTVTELGTVDGRNTTPLDAWVSVESPDFAQAPLTAGTNYLILEGAENVTWGNWWLLQGFTFERTGDYVEPVFNTVELKFAEVDDNTGKQLKDVTANNGNWVYNKQKSDSVMNTLIDSTAPSNYAFQGAWNSPGMKLGLHSTYGALVFDFEVKTAGIYDLSVAIQSLGANNTGILSIAVENGNGDVTELGTIDGRNTTPLDTWVSVESPEFAVVNLTKGTNHLILKGVTDAYWGNYWLVKGFTFERVEIFGNTYAYIREVNDGRETTYKVVLVGAIDSLDYKKVGFKAYNEDICAMLNTDVIKLDTNKVYNKIIANGVEYTPADFGIDEGGYIFTVEYDVPSLAAAMSVDFWAYAETVEGTTVEGGKSVIPSLAKAQ